MSCKNNIDSEIDFGNGDELTQAEAEHYKDIPAEGTIEEEEEEAVFEIKEPKKKGRAPMSEERKEVLREQLRVAREKKKALKAEANAKGKELEKPPKVVKVLDKTEKEPAVYVKNVRKIIKDPEAEALKKELAEMKKAKANELAEKQAKKEATAAKRKANKEKKELDKKLAGNKVATPAPPIKKEQAQVEPIPPGVERYSTYKKSIWAKFV